LGGIACGDLVPVLLRHAISAPAEGVRGTGEHVVGPRAASGNVVAIPPVGHGRVVSPDAFEVVVVLARIVRVTNGTRSIVVVHKGAHAVALVVGHAVAIANTDAGVRNAPHVPGLLAIVR